MESQKNYFHPDYILIPVELFDNPNLNKVDCVIFGFVYILDQADGCVASNEFLSAAAGTCERTVTNSVARLKKEGYIYQEQFNGRIRTLRVCKDFKETHKHIKEGFNNRMLEYKKRSVEERTKSAKKDLSTQSRKMAVLRKESNYKEILDKESSKKEEEGRAQNRPKVQRRSKTPLSEKEEKKGGDTSPPVRTRITREEIIKDYWNSFNILSKHKAGGAPEKRALAKIKKAFKNHSFDQIKFTIDRYHSLLQDPYAKVPLNAPGMKVSLEEFFGFSSFTRDRMKQRKVDFEYDSWFDCILDEGWRRFLPKVVPMNEKVVKRLKRKYSEFILGKEGKFTEVEEEKFVMASNRLVQLREEVENKLLMPYTVYEFVDHLIEALRDNYQNGNIEVGHLCSNHTFNSVFPQYLNRMSIIGEEEL